jgi:sec-independent protein translocase protein TatA
MFGNAITGWHALILLVVVVLLFGATKLPALAKSVGQSMKIFKNEIKNPDKEDKGDTPDDTAGDVQPKPKP